MGAAAAVPSTSFQGGVRHHNTIVGEGKQRKALEDQGDEEEGSSLTEGLTGWGTPSAGKIDRSAEALRGWSHSDLSLLYKQMHKKAG